MTLEITQSHGESAMTDPMKWQRLFRSANREIRLRAARALVERDDTPAPILLEILDYYSHDGLGALAERALLRRPAADLHDAAVERLSSSDDFVRQVACRLLGESDRRATLPLLGMFDDPHVLVRRAAGWALAALGDTSALGPLRRLQEIRAGEDINVRMAIEGAIQRLQDSADVDQ
ncbi:MAG: HEAT repeat domain-containing protein [Planctomycetaceae bacterium]|nr:HEAT repeat domain-containing protein [Planctomycetaceae bacterium]